MKCHEIELRLSKIVNDYVNLKINNSQVIEELIHNIDSDWIYNIEDDFMITDCYFALKHLCEEGFETTMAEIIYFDECFRGIRKYSLDEKNECIKNYYKLHT